ncbi:hypothetical protein [Turicimonas muris]
MPNAKTIPASAKKSPFREFIENVLMLAVTAAFVYICLALPFGY